MKNNIKDLANKHGWELVNLIIQIYNDDNKQQLFEYLNNNYEYKDIAFLENYL